MLAKDLTYFAAIAEKGSLAKAALFLSVSQPALTKCVHRLETQLQVKLFNRTPDGVSLTSIGRTFYARIQTVGMGLEDAIREVRDFRLGISGDVRFGITPSIPHGMLNAAYDTFARASAGSRVTVLAASIGSLLPELIAGNLDFLVGPRPIAERKGVEYEQLFQDVVQLFVSKDHPLVQAKSFTPADLLKYPWVLPRGADNYHRAWLGGVYRALNLPAPQPVVEVELMEHAFALVCHSRLLALGARRKVLEAEKIFPIRGLSLAPMPDDMDCGITTRRGAYISPAATKLKDAFRAAAARLS